MSKSILKYPISVSTQYISVPGGGIPRYVGEQYGNLYVWIEALGGRTGAEEEMVSLTVIGTGWEVPEDHRYVGTIKTTGDYVWHAYTPLVPEEEGQR